MPATRAPARRSVADARGEDGYTLIELLVTLVIIGVLIAIAVPLFREAVERSEDTAVRTTLRDGLVAAHVWYTDDQTYEGFDPVAAEGVEPSVTWTDTDPGFGGVAIVSATEDAVHLVGWSRSGRYLCIRDNEVSVAASSLTYGSGATFDSVDEPAECDDPTW